MAEELPENPQPAEGVEPAEEDMEVETDPVQDQPNGAEDPAAKRGREEGDGEEGAGSKRRRVDKSFEEERLVKFEGRGEGGEELEEGDGDGEEEPDGKEEGGGDLKEGGGDDEKESTEANVGPKVFTSSVEMFDYFYKLLHSWPPNLDINRYEHMVLLDLLKKGHPEPAKKIGSGIHTFQVRYHPTWKSRCFFLVQVDGTADDFSFRKCVNNILPLPDNMKAQLTSGGVKVISSKKGGNGSGRGGRGRGRRGGFRK